VSIGTNIVLSVLLAPLYGINGLALANSIATLAEAALFMILLAPRARLKVVGIGTSSLKVIAASLLMGIAMFAFIRATNITVDLQQTKIGCCSRPPSRSPSGWSRIWARRRSSA